MRDVTQKLVVLASTQSVADEIERVVAERKSRGEVIVLVVEGAASAATATARSTHPSEPLAVVANAEADAIEAISAGADEALVLPAIDARNVELLFDRTNARARVRLMNAAAHGDVAHAEKLAALGTLVAGVAHEINNPLASVMLSVSALKLVVEPLMRANEELQRHAAANEPLHADDVRRLAIRSRNGMSANDARTMLDDMAVQTQTIADIVRDLRIYSRSDEHEAAQVVDVTSLIDQVLRIVGPQIQDHAHIERDYASDLPLLVMPRSRVVQVLTNVLINASHAIAEVRRPVHRVRITVRADAEFVAVSISDTGPGIPPELLARIFDPFFTTKEVGVGTGLGLAISQQILRRVGGDLLAESVHGVGATFIALLPVPDAAAVTRTMRARPRDQVVNQSAQRPVVLVVEDDERLLRAYPRTLQEHYDVITACDGQEAIDLLVSGSTADVVMTDLAMPEVDGQAFYAWLVDNQPALARKTLFVTGGARDVKSAEFLKHLQGHVVLEKPVTRDALLAAIDRVLAAP